MQRKLRNEYPEGFLEAKTNVRQGGKNKVSGAFASMVIITCFLLLSNSLSAVYSNTSS